MIWSKIYLNLLQVCIFHFKELKMTTEVYLKLLNSRKNKKRGQK